MEYAFVLLMIAAASVGVTSAVVRTWALHRRTYSLEDRVNVLEGIQQREVKIRAAETRWKRPNVEELALTQALANPPAPKYKGPWWKSPAIAKRSHAT